MIVEHAAHYTGMLEGLLSDSLFLPPSLRSMADDSSQLYVYKMADAHITLEAPKHVIWHAYVT